MPHLLEFDEVLGCLQVNEIIMIWTHRIELFALRHQGNVGGISLLELLLCNHHGQMSSTYGRAPTSWIYVTIRMDDVIIMRVDAGGSADLLSIGGIHSVA